MNVLMILFCLSLLFAQIGRITLYEVSNKINQNLPEIYDPVTKLQRTTVENNNLIYHFLIDAGQKEYDWALPKVKTQILSNVCTNQNQNSILSEHQANIIFRYENTKGQSLGQFMVQAGHCKKRRR